MRPKGSPFRSGDMNGGTGSNRKHRIAVIEDRRILEQGTRAELLALGGAYAALEKAQDIAGTGTGP